MRDQFSENIQRSSCPILHHCINWGMCFCLYDIVKRFFRFFLKFQTAMRILSRIGIISAMLIYQKLLIAMTARLYRPRASLLLSYPTYSSVQQSSATLYPSSPTRSFHAASSLSPLLSPLSMFRRVFRFLR